MNAPQQFRSPVSVFEHTACGRCGGSGYFGPACVSRGLCFGCSGRGWVHTKRGAAANAFLSDLLHVPASELQVGDRYFVAGFSAGSFSEPSRWIKITAITRNEQGKLDFDGIDVKRGSPYAYQGLTDDFKVRKAWGAEEKAPKIAAAHAYAATLTKAGKVRKAAAKEEA